MRTVAVSGASSTLGRAVVGHLKGDAGVDRVLDIDAMTGELKSALQGVEDVIHLAWDRPARGHAVGASASVSRTRALLDATGAAGVGHLVFLSSATVYGAWPGNPVPLSEEVPLRPNPGLAHAVELGEAERLMAEWRDDHPGSTAAVLRPTVVVGTGAIEPFASALAGIGLRPEEATRPVQFVHVDDVASAVLLAWRARLDGAFNVAPDGWIPDETMRALAGGSARVAVPARLGRLLRIVAATAGVARPWPGTEAYSRHPWVVANDRLRSAGWVPQHTNEEAFVESGGGSRWHGVSPRRRQELALVGTAATALALVGTALWAVRRRR